MIVRLLRYLFKHLIGDLPEEEKKELWIKFNELLASACEGMVRGAKS